MNRTIQIGLAAALAAFVFNGCSGASLPATTQPAANGIPTFATINPSNNAPAGASTNPFMHNNVTVTGHVGDTLSCQTYDGSAVEGTLGKVFDPAVGTDQYEEPLPSGFHWVGVEVTLNNHSG